MKLEKIINRYKLDLNELEIIINGLLEDKGLSFIVSALNGKLTKEQVFAVAKTYCLTELDLNIRDISPLAVADRAFSHSRVAAKIKANSEIIKDIKYLTAIKDDLLCLEKELTALHT